MPTTVTSVSSGPYAATADTTFAVTFQSAGDEEIVVTLDGDEVSASAYTFTRDDDGTGDVVFDTAVTGEVMIYSDPDFGIDTDFQRHGPFFPDYMNAPLDRLARQALYLKDAADRAIVVPSGEDGFELPSSSDRVGGYLGFDSNGDPAILSAVQQIYEGYADFPFIDITTIQANTVPGTTDFYAAMQTAMAILTIVRSGFTQWPAAGKIVFPPGIYYMSQQATISKAVIIEGCDGGGPAGSGHSTRIIAATNQGVFRFVHELTAGFTTSAAGSIVKGIYFEGSGTSETTAAIIANARIQVIDCGAEGFGNGLEFYGELNLASPPPRGDVSSFYVSGGRFTGNRDSGIKIGGGDSNAFTIEHCDFVGNGNWAIKNESFLGGMISGCHAAQNGIVAAGVPRTLWAICTYGGKTWTVVPGQETAASTQAPGTGNAWTSEFIFPEGNPIGTPAWTTGLSWKAGGPYLCSSTGGTGNVLHNCYSESNQPPSQLTNPAFAIHGTQGAGIVGTWIRNHSGAVRCDRGFSSTGKVQFGAGVGEMTVRMMHDPAYGTALDFSHALSGGIYQFGIGGATGEMYFGITNLSIAWSMTSVTTTYQFGRGIAQPGKLRMAEVFLGNENDARCVTYAAAAPGSGPHAAGEIVYNIAPTAGGFVGWVCTTAGTPGVWKTFGAISV